MKSSLQITLLPTLLVVSLALSACQKASSPNDIEAQNDGDNNSIADSMSAATAAVAISPEQQMIDSLSKYRWTLDTAYNSNKQPLTSLMTIKDQVTLSFNDYQGQNTINYSVGCNTMSAAYQLQGDTFTTENSMSTKMSCADLNSTENRLNELMEGDSVLSLADGDTPLLTQVTSDAVTLVWTGRMTSQAKYHSKGETLFWSISAQTKPCTGDSSQQCLQIKPVTYDEQGVKVSEGKEVEFAGTIEGYQHDKNHDEVLRLQRYKLEGNENLAKISDAKYAYVLDTVIESTVIESTVVE